MDQNNLKEKLLSKFKPVETQNKKYKKFAKSLAFLTTLITIVFIISILIFLSETQLYSYQKNNKIILITFLYIICLSIIKVGEIIIVIKDNI